MLGKYFDGEFTQQLVNQEAQCVLMLDTRKGAPCYHTCMLHSRNLILLFAVISIFVQTLGISLSPA